MTPPKNTTVSEGQRVKLTCQAEGYPNNITYRWYKNGVDVQGVNGLMSRAGVYADGSFVISNVIKNDYGWYKCRPSNGLGPPPEASAYLNVTCKLDLEFRFSSVFLPHCVFRHFFCHIVFFVIFSAILCFCHFFCHIVFFATFSAILCFSPLFLPYCD